MKLLLVEDDHELAAMLESYLRSHGALVTHAADGETGLQRALEEPYELLILDVMLPRMDGFTVLSRVRERSAVPVVMLTARGDRGDRVRGLDLGADDYLPKPFGPEELLARIRAILRRTQKPNDLTVLEPISVGRLRLYPGTREALLDGQPLDLTAMESDILEEMMRLSGRVVSRDHLSMRLYNRTATPFDRSLDTHVSRIRRKLGEARDLIISIRGTGYQLRDPGNEESQ